MRIPARSLRCAALALGLLAGCAPIRYSAEEVLLRHDAEADTLEVLILYEGIQANPQDGGKDGLAVAEEFSSRVALGRREFMIFDWPLHLDLEGLVGDLANVPEDATDPWSAWKREGLVHLGAIRVVASGYYAGEKDSLSLYQRFRVERASRLVEWFDRALRIWIDEARAQGTLDKKMPVLAPETRAAWVELAAAKGRWLRLADGGIEVKLPMSPTDAAGVFAVVLGPGWSDVEDVKGPAAFAAALTEIEIGSGHLRLAWKAKDGVLALRLAGPKEYDGSLAKRLRSGDALPPQPPAREDVIRAFRGG